MKKLILITFGGLMLTGCVMNKKCGITEPIDATTIVFAVDSSGIAEDPNRPGTFYQMYDTIYIAVKNEVDRNGDYKFDKNGNYKTTYKILNK